jgi:membrane associated rhomboid family serine protease
MTDPDQPRRDGRLETMAPGVPVAAKVALLAGLAGGLFAAIVTSYVDNSRQFQVLAAGILAGAIGAVVLTLRKRRLDRNS